MAFAKSGLAARKRVQSDVFPVVYDISSGVFWVVLVWARVARRIVPYHAPAANENFFVRFPGRFSLDTVSTDESPQEKGEQTMNNKTMKKVATLAIVAACAAGAMAAPGRGPRPGGFRPPPPMHHGPGPGGYHRHHHHDVGFGIAAGIVGAAATAAIVRDIVSPRPVVYTTPTAVYTTPVYTAPAPVVVTPAPVVVAPPPPPPPPPTVVYRW